MFGSSGSWESQSKKSIRDVNKDLSPGDKENTAAILQEIHSLIICNICDNTATLNVLKCGHLFCMSCINKFPCNSTNSRTRYAYRDPFNCPVCRSEIDVGSTPPVEVDSLTEIKTLLASKISRSMVSVSTQTAKPEMKSVGVNVAKPAKKTSHVGCQTIDRDPVAASLNKQAIHFVASPDNYKISRLCELRDPAVNFPLRTAQATVWNDSVCWRFHIPYSEDENGSRRELSFEEARWHTTYPSEKKESVDAQLNRFIWLSTVRNDLQIPYALLKARTGFKWCLLTWVSKTLLTIGTLGKIGNSNHPPKNKEQTFRLQSQPVLQKKRSGSFQARRIEAKTTLNRLLQQCQKIRRCSNAARYSKHRHITDLWEQADKGEGKDRHKPIGHYTQLVWAESARVGCGYARCNRTASFYVCNYAPTGNYISDQYTPYKPGPTASSCPNTSKSGLCDCGGKVCKNGGELDLDTCQCKCLNKKWIDSDPEGDCSLRCSEAEDIFMCASHGGSWDINHCEKYVNVPHEYCPITCRLCPAHSSEDITPPHSVADQVDGVYKEAVTKRLPLTTPAISYDYRGKEGEWKALRGNFNENTQIPETTIPFIGEATKPTTTTTTTTPAPTSPDPGVARLPLCSEPVEPAKCGQPSSRGYYNPVYCDYGLDFYCPAMCGKCRVTSCVDYDLNNYQPGETWMNQFGKLTCTATGVKVQRGCYIEKLDIVLDEEEEYNYVDGNISWSCTCASAYSLSCKGVWSPSGLSQH